MCRDGNVKSATRCEVTRTRNAPGLVLAHLTSESVPSNLIIAQSVAKQTEAMHHYLLIIISYPGSLNIDFNTVMREQQWRQTKYGMDGNLHP